MNRSVRRQFNKQSKINDKFQTKAAIKRGAKMMNDPCTYCNNKPLYVGDVVYLKPQHTTPFKYDNQLRQLIQGNHRFVISSHKGIKKGTCGIILLSTSEYLNEQQRLGIKLSGKYNKTKDVYMDTFNLWVIDTSAILEKDYSLNEVDKSRCVSSTFDKELPIKNVRIGTYNSDNVLNTLEEYKYTHSIKANEEFQYAIDVNTVKEFVNELTIEQSTAIINKTDPEIRQQIVDGLAYKISKDNLHITAEQLCRWAAAMCLHFDEDLHDIYKRRYTYE